MTIIKSTTIPHNFRNRFLKNSGSSTVTNNENNSTSGGGQQFIPRNLWGQYFDDTQDIDGDLTSSGTIAGQQGNFSGAIYGMQGNFGPQGIQSTGKVIGQQGKFGSGGMETTGAIKASGNITSNAAIQAYSNIVSSNGGMQAKSNIISDEGYMKGVQMISDTFKTINFVPADGWIGQGFGVQTDSNNISSLQTDNLTVLGTMLVHTLNIREVSYIGGSYLLTPAASTVQAVQNLYINKPDPQAPDGEVQYWTTTNTGSNVVGYRLLWKADDGSTYTMNYWKVGDIAYCHTFNITAPGQYTNVQNQNYKRLVVNVGTTEIDGTEYHFADVANVNVIYLRDETNEHNLYYPNPIQISSYPTSFVGYMTYSTTPKAEDKIVCLGAESYQRSSEGRPYGPIIGKDRQGTIEINAEGEASIGIYDGIYDFRSLNNYEIHYFSKTEVRMNANYMKWTAGPQGMQSQYDFMNGTQGQISTLTMGQQGIALGVQNINTGLQTAGINLSTGKITSKADKFEWLNNDNEPILGMQGTEATFYGTVKAKNFFHAVTYYMEGNKYTDQNNESWGYCVSTTYTYGADTYDLTQAGIQLHHYYSLSEIEAMTTARHDIDPDFPIISDWVNSFKQTSYMADIIVMTPTTHNWNYYGSDDDMRTVLLPDPKDFFGKTVQISAFCYGATDNNLPRVGCIKTGKMAGGVLIIGSNGIYISDNSSPQTSRQITTSRQYTFISVYAATSNGGTKDYYWVQLYNIPQN